MNRFLLNTQVLVLLLLLKIPDLYSQPFVEQTDIVLPGVLGSSASWGDYDNDGDLDILLTGDIRISRIYRNEGDNVFTWQEDIDLTDIRYGSAVWGDYDNDGDLDILMTGTEYARSLTRIHCNNGDNTFTCKDEFLIEDVCYSSADWGDYDNDGDLDFILTGQLYANYKVVSKIYRNDKGSGFTEQTEIALAEIYNGSVVWGDYDNDSDLDILLTGINQKGTCVSRIYRNNGNSTFSDQTNINLQAVGNSSVAWGDYDNDGDLDILLTGSGISRIYRNNGDNTFTEQTGISLYGVSSSSAAWGDYDNDGDPDILLTGSGISRIYRNDGNNSFTWQNDIVLQGIDNGSVAWGDYDNDGDLDILLTGSGISKIYRNELNIPNLKTDIPTNLQVVTNNGIAAFTCDKASDTETPQNGLSYNLYVYESGQTDYKLSPHAFRQTDANNGRRLISKIGNIQWASAGYSLKNLPPEKTLYWSVQAVDAGLQGGSFSTEQSFTIPLYTPNTPADDISFSNLKTTQVNVSWKNGGGVKRAVFIKATAAGTADPADNTTYLVNSVTPGGWKCVYNGTGNSVAVTGLNTNTDYLIQVCEYNGSAGSEKYLKSPAFKNPAPLRIVFTEQVTLTGVHSGSAAWGDYDKDGDLDILLTGATTGIPPKSWSPVSRIYRNDGSNIFTLQTGITLTGVLNSSVAWGDYDNDGDIDILLTGYTGSGSISKVYRNIGSNTFSEQTHIVLTGVRNGSAAWGDYDIDGDLDILLTGSSSSGNISEIYRNNGDNSFTKQTGIKLTGVFFSSAAWGDYDNDGDLDIILSGATGDYPNYNPVTKIYRNNGNNNFIELTDISLKGVFNSSLSWGDYDNDGDLDILLIGQDGLSEHFSKIYQNDGDDNFTEKTDILLQGVNNGASKWGDYDNDGDLDILIAGYNGSKYVSLIYHNNGDNSFTLKEEIPVIGVYFSSVVWGDYENDGDLDILLTGLSGLNSVTKVFRNEISIPNIKPSVPSGLSSHWNNDTITFNWNKSSDNTTPPGALCYNIRIGTSSGGNQIRSSQALSGTGKLLLTDIANIVSDTCVKFILQFNKYYWSVQAIDNGNMAGSFASEQTTPLDSIQARDLQAYIRSSNSLLIRWKNGNGLRRALFGRLSSLSEPAEPVDGIVYNAEPIFGLGDKIGTTGWYCMFNGKADSAIIYGIDEGQSYDIQIIEYIEIANLPVYFDAAGSGNPGIFSTSVFSELTSIVLPPISGGTVVWGDYDNDGDLDILLSGESSSGAISKIYRNNGNNSFTEQTSISLTGMQYSSAAWGDYDNDVDLDILLIGVSGNPISKIYRNDGGAGFTEQTEITLAEIYMGSVVWGDYDNDGDLDILLTGATTFYPNYNQVSVIYMNNGNNNFVEQNQIVLPGVRSGSVAWGDYDNDGDLDILLTGNSFTGNITKIFKNNGDNTYTNQAGIVLPGSWFTSVAWGDYDNDEDLDILLESKVYQNNGNNTFTEQVGIIFTEFRDHDVYGTWGDFDNDGDLDIAFAGQTTSDNKFMVFCNNGDNTFTDQINIKIPAEIVTPPVAGDYDNDGDIDVLLGYKVYNNNTFMKAGIYPPNKKPAAPTDLSVKNLPQGTMLSWSPVKDDVTSYKTMTYNVQVIEAQSGLNVCSYQSDSVSGYRRIVAMGNAQLDTTFLLKNLSSTKFYWRVQAVDQGYQGGEWSAVDSFEVKNVQAFYSNDEVCLGYSTHFTDQSIATDGIASWKWDFKDGSTSSLQNPVHNYSSSGTYNVKLVITDNNGIRDSLEHSVIVRPKPLAGFTAADVCQGIPVTSTNTTNNNGLTVNSWYWDFGDGSTSASEQPGPHGYLNTGDYTIKLKAVASNGCADSIIKVVSVGAYPVAAVTANAPLTFCKGDSVTLSVPYDNSYTYVWKIGEVNITGAESSSYIAKFTGTFFVKIVNPKGNCSATSSGVAINVLDAPAAPLISVTGDTTFCQGDSVILSVINTLNYSYQWRLNGGAVGSNSNQVTAQTGGIYDLIVSNSNGCSVNSNNSVTITVNPAPSAGNISLNGPDEFCEGGSVTMSVPSTSGYAYNWRNQYGIISGETTNSYTTRVSGTYQLEISNTSGCCVKTSPATVKVRPSPAKPQLQSTNYTKGVCPGLSPISLRSANTEPGYSYQWIRDNVVLKNDTLSYIEFYEEGTYKLKVAIGECTSESDTVISLPESPAKPTIYSRGPEVWYLVCSNTLAHDYKWYCEGKLIEGADKYYYVANNKIGSYYVIISNTQGCYTRSDVVAIPEGYTGIDDINLMGGVNIYPNPTTEVFTIELNNNVFGKLEIEIISEQGKEIRSITSEKTSGRFKTEIDLADETKGIYFVNLRIDKYIATRKVILE